MSESANLTPFEILARYVCTLVGIRPARVPYLSLGRAAGGLSELEYER